MYSARDKHVQNFASDISFGFLIFHFPVFQAITEVAVESRHCGFSVGAAMITNLHLPHFATFTANVSNAFVARQWICVRIGVLFDHRTTARWNDRVDFLLL